MGYEVKLLVADSHLGTLLGLALEPPKCRLVSVTPLADPEPAQSSPPETIRIKHQEYANGIRNKGIKGRDLALLMIPSGRTVHRSVIEAEFADKGFSANSAGPALSTLKKARLIEKLPGEKYRRIDQTPNGNLPA